MKDKGIRSVSRLFMAFAIMVCCACTSQQAKTPMAEPSGSLFIIGGGKRPATMIERLIREAGLRDNGYGIILPMSSSEPDSAIFYAKKQFTKAGIDNIIGMNISVDAVTDSQLDSLMAAQLIYITGGDQVSFMNAVGKSAIYESIHQAYHQGAVIAGTSAGAAVMSEVMITGNEKRYPDYKDTFENVEADNIETAEGLGLIGSAIIDQHFVKRSRYNRLISAVATYPALIGIGIDEATAILVKGDSAEVLGESQVIVMRNPTQTATTDTFKIGLSNLRMDVLLPGTKFSLIK